MKVIDNIQLTRFLMRMSNVIINTLKQFSLIFLAFVIFISTTGFKFTMHFCNEDLYDIGVFSKAQSCCNNDTHYHDHCGMENETKSPCENESIEFQKLDNFIGSSITFDFSNFVVHNLIPVITIIYNLIDQAQISEEILFIKESPSLQIATTLPLLQSFLI